MHFVIDLGCQIDEMRCEENFSISCLKASGKLRINRVTHLWIAVARISIGFCYFWPSLFFSRGDESTYLIKTLRDFQEFVWSALQQKSQCLKIRQKVSFYNIASEASYVYFKIQTLTMQIAKKRWKIRKMARWRFQNMFSILPIFSDFLSTKCFKIPISLRKHFLICPYAARFARTHEKMRHFVLFSNTVVKARAAKYEVREKRSVGSDFQTCALRNLAAFLQFFTPFIFIPFWGFSGLRQLKER